MTFADTIFATVLSPIFGSTAVHAFRKGKIDWLYGYVWTRFYYYDPITEDDDFLMFWGWVLSYAALSVVSGYFAYLGWTGAPVPS
jgi:hypothetical protein